MEWCNETYVAYQLAWHYTCIQLKGTWWVYIWVLYLPPFVLFFSLRSWCFAPTNTLYHCLNTCFILWRLHAINFQGHTLGRIGIGDDWQVDICRGCVHSVQMSKSPANGMPSVSSVWTSNHMHGLSLSLSFHPSHSCRLATAIPHTLCYAMLHATASRMPFPSQISWRALKPATRLWGRTQG